MAPEPSYHVSPQPPRSWLAAASRWRRLWLGVVVIATLLSAWAATRAVQSLTAIVIDPRRTLATEWSFGTWIDASPMYLTLLGVMLLVLEYWALRYPSERSRISRIVGYSLTLAIIGFLILAAFARAASV